MINKSYEQVDIPAGAVVYCDIPYENTDCGVYDGLDHAAFYDWAASRPFPVYISSYEISDPRFECVWEIDKYQLHGGSGAKVKERIFTQKR